MLPDSVCFYNNNNNDNNNNNNNNNNNKKEKKRKDRILTNRKNYKVVCIDDKNRNAIFG